jgi:beta-phosphoglucomutase-like phosphatase (HAD superfamily)
VFEDSRIGAIGALASGATVIGFAGGAHCFDGHADVLRGLGVKHIAHNFDEARELVGLD